jgi:hypothetical protein
MCFAQKLISWHSVVAEAELVVREVFDFMSERGAHDYLM